VTSGGTTQAAARPPVLVVDDDRDIRETLQELIEDEGFPAVVAKNGADALARMRERRPCLVILDLFMPVMDGAEFRRQQLADAALADVPVVVVSAAASLDERVASMRPDGYLEKPLRLERLLEIVARFCA
jgi:CheY-like chemotaxis protein